jgi:hypothetical protein
VVTPRRGCLPAERRDLQMNPLDDPHRAGFHSMGKQYGEQNRLCDDCRRSLHRRLALYDFGLSREAVRSGATVAAILIGAAVAIDFFGKKSGKAE